jgi:tight adherence protein C
MNSILFDFLPLIAGITFAFFVYILASFIKNKKSELNARQRRVELLERYQLATKNQFTSFNKQFSMVQVVVGAYGSSLVKDNYKSRLQKLLVSSGDWENQRYSNLVRSKVFFAAAGFVVGFLFLVLNQPQFLPIVVALILVSYFLPDLESFFLRSKNKKYSKKLRQLLDQSGSWQENELFRLIRRKLLFAVGSFLFSYLYLVIRTGNFGSFIFTLVAIFLGFFLPDVLLQNKVLKRKTLLADSFADAIDMLQMCVSAGLSFPAALSKVAETQSGPVSEEFARVTTEVQLGQSRADALTAMADRTQEPNIQKFVSSMMQVDRFGIPVGNVLIEQSREMRATRRERARERGQKVPIKILGPIMLCFLPSVLLIVLGPAVLSIIQAFSKQ